MEILLGLFCVGWSLLDKKFKPIGWTTYLGGAIWGEGRMRAFQDGLPEHF